jgi:hypothetical protein
MDHQELDRGIDGLDEKVTASEGGGRNWKEVWDDIRFIGEQFKSVRYPTKAEKDEARERFQRIVQRMKVYQETERERKDQRKNEWQRKQEAWTQKVKLSLKHKEEIINHAESGRPPNKLAEALAMVILAPLDILARTVTFGHVSFFADRREMLQFWSNRIGEAWRLLKEYKNEMLSQDKQEAFNRLNEIKAECDEAWRELKEAQQQSYETKQQAWRERAEGNVRKLEDRHTKLYSILNHKESHLSDLEEKRDSARSDDYRARVEGWIEEEEGRIRDIRAQIEQVEGWLEDARSRLP